MTILEDKEVKIRKLQKCWGCGREFQKGSKLRFLKQVNDIFQNSYWCETCQTYWIEHMESDDEIYFGDLKANDNERWEAIRLMVEEKG